MFLGIVNLTQIAEGTTPLEVELGLQKIIPKKMVRRTPLEGRLVCTSRSPKCYNCRLNEICPSAKV